MILISSIAGSIILLSIFLTSFMETVVLCSCVILSFMIYFVYICTITESKCFVNNKTGSHLFVPLKSYTIPLETYRTSGLLKALFIFLSPKLPYIYHILGLILGFILLGIFNINNDDIEAVKNNMFKKIRLATAKDKAKINILHSYKIRELKAKETKLKNSLREAKETNSKIDAKKNKIRNEVISLLSSNVDSEYQLDEENYL